MKTQVCILLVLLSFQLQAKELTMSWRECLTKVETENLEIRAAKETWQQNQEAEAAAKAAFYPEISISFSSSRSMLKSSPNATSNPSDSASLNINQNLFSGFGDQARVRSAQLNTHIAELDYLLVKARIDSTLKQAVVNWLYSKDLLNLNQSILSRRQENLRIVELNFNGGRENKGSVLLSQAYRELALNEIEVATSEIKIAQNELRTVLNLDRDFQILITEIPFESPRIPVLKLDPSLDYSAISQKTLEYLQAQTHDEISKSGVESTRGSYYPSLDLVGNIGRTGPDSSIPYDKWYAGVTLTIPLFTGGKDFANHHVALAKLRSTEALRLNILQQQILKLEKAFTDYRNSYNKLKINENFQKAQRIRAEIARQKYNNGLMNFENWDLIENDLIQKEQALLSGWRDFLYNQATWEQSLNLGINP